MPGQHHVSRFHLSAFCDPASTGTSDPWLWIGSTTDQSVRRRSPKNVATVPGLIDQRQGGELRDPLIGAEGVVDRPSERLGAGASDRTTMKFAVGEPRTVRQEIAERDRPLGRVRLVQRTTRIAQNANTCEIWCMSRDWQRDTCRRDRCY